ncbi:unnamed protein product [Chrysodeixis includens]|uniref:Uncharacterized protein n=1 Tax=Chrysodeixis includens TaxID=689277 RepID=A0A9N8PYC2_CHRIL|nr:unnamed protein product [Chrysodeixis includens]
MSKQKFGIAYSVYCVVTNNNLTGGGSHGGGGGQQGSTGGQHTGGGEHGGGGSGAGQRRGLQGGSMGTMGGTQSGITGAGHCLNTGRQLHGGHGVQGTGGGQHGWQHGHGGGHEYLQGPVPHGKIAGQLRPLRLFRVPLRSLLPIHHEAMCLVLQRPETVFSVPWWGVLPVSSAAKNSGAVSGASLRHGGDSLLSAEPLQALPLLLLHGARYLLSEEVQLPGGTRLRRLLRTLHARLNTALGDPPFYISCSSVVWSVVVVVAGVLSESIQIRSSRFESFLLQDNSGNKDIHTSDKSLDQSGNSSRQLSALIQQMALNMAV